MPDSLLELDALSLEILVQTILQEDNVTNYHVHNDYVPGWKNACLLVA